MNAQVVTLAGDAGTVARIIGGVTTIASGVWVAVATRKAWPSLRVWWQAFAGSWIGLGLGLLFGALGLWPTLWTPYAVIGLLVACSAILIGLTRCAVTVHLTEERRLLDAMGDDQ